MDEPKQPRSMGLPKEWNDIIFARKFRWTLESEFLSCHFITNVDIDYVKKEMQFDIMEAASSTGIEVWKWLDMHNNPSKYDGTIMTYQLNCSDDPPKEHLVNYNSHTNKPQLHENFYLTTYDGCGVSLYTIKFNTTFLVGDRVNFDYASSDVSKHTITLRFRSYEVLEILQPKGIKTEDPTTYTVSPPPDQNTITITDSNGKVLSDAEAIEILVPPMSLEYEHETEINFLNAKTWLPGFKRLVQQTPLVAVATDSRWVSFLENMLEDKVGSKLNAIIQHGNQTYNIEGIDIKGIRAKDDKYYIKLKYARCTL